MKQWFRITRLFLFCFRYSRLYWIYHKKHENAPSFEVVEVVLFQCNLVGSQYQEKPEVLYTFTPNKSYAYLLHVEANNLVFWKTYNTESDEIIITFTDQNGRPLERGNKVNLTLLIHK